MTLANWTVLVVEDENDSMELVEELLAYHNISSVPARSGEEALEALRDFVPTLIIIDLALPGIDGWSLLTAIREDTRLHHVPCVATTAYYSAETADHAIKAGFDAYFPKPLEATSFVRELQRIVDE
ncbi:MAG: response regulator [Anaerolineae bacterium]|nr:response regulator [Anaerolineae bacterium]